MNDQQLAKKLDGILENGEKQIEKAYGDALARTMKENRKALNEIRAIMDGEKKPPASCVTDEQKESWRRKTLEKLMLKSGLIEKLAKGIVSADAESEIKKTDLETYQTAYNGTLDILRG